MEFSYKNLFLALMERLALERSGKLVVTAGITCIENARTGLLLKKNPT
jgi:hypothetical protein